MTDKQIIIDDQKKTIHRLQDECTEKTNAIIALGERLDQLKAENDELKVQNIKYMNGNISYQSKNSLYKQTLTEIKEIMKKHCRKCKKHKFYNFKLCCTCKYTDILQKISEVEDGV